MFLSQSRRYDDRALYRFAREGAWEKMTWRDARSRVGEIALGLISLGIGKGDRVAMFSGNRVEWCLIDWANICIGALTVPVYASSTMAQLAHILEHSGATVLVVDSADRLKKPDSLGSVRQIVSIEDAGVSEPAVASISCISLAELRRIGREYGQNHGDLFERTASSLRPEDDLTIIYTSGTTGEPKGVLTTHRHYLFMLEAVSKAIPWSDRDVDLLFLPLAHSLGRLEHFLAVAEGFTCGLVRSLETIGKDLLEVRPTILVSVPRIYENAYARVRSRAEAGSRLRRSIFHWAVTVGARWSVHSIEGKRISLLLRAAHGLAHRLVYFQIHAAFGGNLRLAVSGGAPLAPEIAKFFHSVGILILEGYGLTESSTVSHANRPERPKFGTVGLPLPGVECRIGRDGEILLRGQNILKGYYRDPEGTRAALDEEGWLGTGDIGEIDGDGFLRITDRKKDIIVTSGGKNIAPQMIENLLQTEPLIAQAIVLGDGEAHLVALVTLDRDRVLDWAKREGVEFQSAEEIASHPRVTALVKERIREKNKQLSAFEAVRNFRIVPHHFSMERAELTPTLKLRRQVIKERYKGLIEEMARRPRFDLGD
ncbi:MAG TPA: long-chain fatty acid--CoA ligase [Candidatus Binatia bacterium]